MNEGSLRFMDRRLKERLIGATILAALVILVVPELLSGPKGPAGSAVTSGGASESMRTVKVDLATRRAPPDDQSGASPSTQNASPATLSAPAPGSSGPPVTPSAESSADAPQRPTITTLRAQQPLGESLDKAARGPDAAPAASNAMPVREAPAQHGWAVQIGSFASRANADREMGHLKALDESAYLTVSGAGPSLRYKVRIGPFADREAAEKALAKLKKNGESANLIPP